MNIAIFWMQALNKGGPSGEFTRFSDFVKLYQHSVMEIYKILEMPIRKDGKGPELKRSVDSFKFCRNSVPEHFFF